MKVVIKVIVLPIVIFLFIPVHSLGQFNRVTEIDVQEEDSVTVISVTTSGTAQYSSFVLDETRADILKKIVVDIHGALHQLSEKIISFPVGPVKNIRSSQWLEEPAIVRIVADLHTDASVRLEQEDNYVYMIFSNYRAVQVKQVETIIVPGEEQVQEVEPPKLPVVSMLNIRNQSIGQVIEAFMRLYDMNIITSRAIDRTATIDIAVKEFRDPVKLFETILFANDYKYVKRDNIYLVLGKETILEDEFEFRIFKLNYLDANDIINNLSPLISENGDIQAYSRRPIASTDLTIPAGGGAGGAAGGGAAGGMGGTQTALRGFEEIGISEEIEEGKERSTVLLVYETPSRLKKIEKVIKELDKPIPQIHIAVKLVETSLGENEKWGVNWTSIIEAIGAGGQATSTGMQMGGGAAAGGTSENPAEGVIIPGVQLIAENFRFGTLSFKQFKAVMQLLESTEKSKLINQPSVTTLDNQQANMAVGKVIPIEVTQVGMSGMTGGGGGGGGMGGAGMGGAITTVQQQQVNIALSVIPRVNEDKYITLYVKPIVQEITGYTGRNGELPITSTRTTTTQVRVKDGDVIIIGGLIKEDRITVQTRVKFLANLPLFGRLFRHTRLETKRTELIIFIHPSIIRDNAIVNISTDGIH